MVVPLCSKNETGGDPHHQYSVVLSLGNLELEDPQHTLKKRHRLDAGYACYFEKVLGFMKHVSGWILYQICIFPPLLKL